VLVLGLLLVKVGPGVVVGHSIGVGEGSGRDLNFAIGRGWDSVERGRGDAGGESHGSADDSNGEKELKIRKKVIIRINLNSQI
jgi:hypothetical protein